MDLIDHCAKVDCRLLSLLHSLHRFVGNRAFFFSLEDAIEERKQSLAMPVRKQLFVERREAVVSREGKSVGERECWGVERWLKKNEVIASCACIERCAGLKL